jgi:hypothetical protein
MKKFLTGVLTTMMLVVTMGTAVFAASSPNSETALKQQAEAWNNKVTSVTGSSSANEVVSVEAKALDTSTLAQANEKVTTDYKDASVLAMTDLSVPADTDLTNGVTVTMKVPGVLPGDNIKVLHQKSSGDWETLTPSVGNGTVTVTLRSFSPIVVLRVASSNASTGSTGTIVSGNASGTTNSSDGAITGNNNGTSNGTSDSQNGNQTSSGTYGDGYQDGYAAGVASTSQTSNGSVSNGSSGDNTSQANNTGNTATANTVINNYGGSSAGTNSSATSPKTGASLPALPILAVLLCAGVVVCGKKAYNN